MKKKKLAKRKAKNRPSVQKTLKKQKAKQKAKPDKKSNTSVKKSLKKSAKRPSAKLFRKRKQNSKQFAATKPKIKNPKTRAKKPKPASTAHLTAQLPNKIGNKTAKSNVIHFSFENSLISDEELSAAASALILEIERMQKAIKLGYTDDRASLSLPSDKAMLASVHGMIKKKQALKPTCLIVIGIGGSNLGTMAVQEAVLGKMCNILNPKIKVFYSDTVDSDSMDEILKIIRQELKTGNVLVNVVSKSGGTTETIANFEVIAEELRKQRKGYESFVITTDKDSGLWNFAIAKGIDMLEIPKKVGGRYSVLSPVSLFPLGMLGIDIDQLVKGAEHMRNICLIPDFAQNPALASSCVVCIYYRRVINISDTFLFSNDLEGVGKWYRQLMAESIGKEFDRHGRRVNLGITPTVSIGSTDLHSMAQLCLGGPYDKFTTFVSIAKPNSVVKVPNANSLETKGYALTENIAGKGLQEIMNAILQGVKGSYKNSKRPFAEIVLPGKSEYFIGQLLQLKMMEIMFLGALLNLNPFDQPNVEDYKLRTKSILASK